MIRSPERAFLALAVPLGLLLAVVLPPCAAPDEGLHLGRVWSLLDGRLLPPGPGRPAPIPQAIPELHRLVSEGAPSQVTRRSVGATAVLALAPLEPERTRQLVGVSPYPPLVYLPALLGVGLGRAAGAPAGVLVWLGRIANLAAWCGLAALAIRLCPVRRWTLVLLALMPMSLAMAASVSADAVTVGVAFLFVALMLRAALAARPLDRVDVAALLGAALALGLVKNGYQPLGMLALTLPAARCGGRARWLALAAGLVLAASVPTALWQLALQSTAPPPASPLADPAAQLRHVLADPLGFLAVLVATVRSEIGLWARSFVGLLGPATTWLPGSLYAAWGVALVGVALSDGPLPTGLGAPRRVLLGVAFAACALAVLAGAYVGWNPPRAERILGVQGRYFVPAAPALLLALPALARPLPSAARAGLLLFAVASGLATAATVAARYYAPS